MKLQLLDILIIALYLIGMVVIGLILKKRASQNMDSYFLGGKSLFFGNVKLSRTLIIVCIYSLVLSIVQNKRPC